MSRALYLREKDIDTHWIRGWVDPTIDQNGMEKRTFFILLAI
jgi:hypothetical protein